MHRERLEFALERLDAGDWERFEEFASEFLVSEFDNLRTTASRSGDRGRDAEIILPQSNPSVFLQYSVTSDWGDKLRRTARQIQKEFPSARIVVYVTNQLIGADADELKRDLMKETALYIDIRDRTWFLERFKGDLHREAAAEALARDIVDPYLASRSVFTSKGQALDTLETRAALLYLDLQWEDDTRDKGLTRLSFEALVRSVLRDTDSENRLSRSEIKARVRTILPTHSEERVNTLTDSALNHLTKRAIRHWTKLDEFCLTNDERNRLKERLTEVETADLALERELRERVSLHLRESASPEGMDVEDMVARARRVLEIFLLSRGELFASAVKGERYRQVGFDQLHEIIVADVAKEPPVNKQPIAIDFVQQIVRDVVLNPGEATQKRLRALADAYTLMAFLRETPDVQSAVTKMFSHGEIWLDTTVALPLFSEQLFPESERRFTNTLAAAVEAGIRIKLTWGVVEEIERHMNRALTRARMTPGEWKGGIPYLYAEYIRSGQAPNGFGNWLNLFRGNARPVEDIADYLSQNLGFGIGSLEEYVDKAEAELRTAVQEIWFEAHEARRQQFTEWDPNLVHRLVRHDVENYVGVIECRKGERGSALGYTAWWLTLDRIAFEVEGKLKSRLSGRRPDSPVMSVDFLVNYLAFGPIRGHVSKKTETTLPLMVDLGFAEFVPPELIEIAERVRMQAEGQPEYVVMRMVRDAIDAAKRRLGPIARQGLETP